MKLFIGIMTVAVCLWANIGHAGTDRVVAVVNDQVLTMSQLEARTTLNLRQSGLKAPTPEQMSALKKRTLAALIDEELQRQYAETNHLNPGTAEIAKAKQDAINNLGADTWASLTKGLEAPANDKLAAEIRWQSIVAAQVRPKIEISPVEVDRLIEDLAKSRHVLEREISMILLNPAEGKEDDGQLKQLNEIKARLEKGGTFADEARAYSDDKSAVSGGSLGWFAAGELNPQLEDALDKLQPGQVSEPIRTPMGWHLVRLDNVRTTTPVDTAPQKQYLLYVLAAPDVSDTTVRKQLEKKLDKATSVLRKPFEVKAYFENKQYGETFPVSSTPGWVMEGDMQPGLKAALKDVDAGHWTKAVTLGETFGSVYVADTGKTMPRNLEAYREKVASSLMSNRVELATRRFMRELRQKAFVDVRL